jgi:hypothetical protein
VSWSEIAIIVVAVALLVGWIIWVSASRLDRLHRKVIASRLALDGQLGRRASAAMDLASSGELDPASSVLIAEAAYTVLDVAGNRAFAPGGPAPAAGSSEGAASHEVAAGSISAGSGPWPAVLKPRRLLNGLGEARAMAESDLSGTLRSALDDPDDVQELRATVLGAELLGALAGAWYRAQLARRFHNEAVAQTQRVRRKWYVRAFRLAGRAPMPATVELDDAWPPSLGRPLAPESAL